MSTVERHDKPQELLHGDVTATHNHDDKSEVDIKVNAASEYADQNAQLKNLGVLATGDDIADAEEALASMSLQECIRILKHTRQIHKHDQNFPSALMEPLHDFLDNPDVVANPDKHQNLIHAMKLQALLVRDNSPYAEVRAVADNVGDPDIPSLTIRVWIIGILFSAVGAFVNQLFHIRQPYISVTPDMGQLLAYPLGKAMERLIPAKEFTLFGYKHSTNPGPWNKREHLLVTVMCTLAFNSPMVSSIVMMQALPMWYNQAYAKNPGYQIINLISTNFIGYGMAGIMRRFLVYPSYCVWPSCLTTLALNKAFHSDDSAPVPGPFGKMYTWSRYKFFFIAGSAMFIWFWFPTYIFQALSTFDWLAWIAPHNGPYNNIVGTSYGLGLNPFPTFDWNNLMNGPLVTPLFAIVNQFGGQIIGFFTIIGFYWSNVYNTSYLPINTNKTYDNQGKTFNVSRVIDKRGIFDPVKYQTYSAPWMTAGTLNQYFWDFAAYSSMISYAFLYHRHAVVLGLKSFYRDFRRQFGKRRTQAAAEEDPEDELGEDIHYRLMKQYKEVPEWWFTIVLVISMALGAVGVSVYPTNTSPAVVVFGVILAFIFVIPIGLIYAVAGQQITLSVLAAFLGGALQPGNAVGMTFFKAYGFLTMTHIMSFSKDLKIAHYAKIPPRNTFIAQCVATMVSILVCAPVINFQLGFKDVCTAKAAFKMSCPQENSFFTAGVFWGTIGPKRLFGSGGLYKGLLAGFPVGFCVPIVFYYAQKWFPRNRMLRLCHPVMILSGASAWAPYNFSYYWPGVVVSWISWVYVRKRWLAFWVKYNYILASAFSAGMALSAVLMFFAVYLPNVKINWWGNNFASGCEAKACTRLPIPKEGYFGNAPGEL